MSFLTIRELGIDGDHLELSQTLTSDKDMVVTHLMPKLYKHNYPAGTFRMSIWKDTKELGYSEMTLTEMEALAPDLVGADYAYGHFRFELNRFVRLKKGEYTIKMNSSGYTFSEASYVAWIQAHEDIRYSINGVPQNSFENPLTFELWRNKDATSN